MLDVRSATGFCLAALARAAARSLLWREQVGALRMAADRQLGLRRALLGEPWASHWLSPALATTLARAAGAVRAPVPSRATLVMDALAVAAHAIAQDAGAPRPREQRAAYKALLPLSKDVPVATFVARRLTTALALPQPPPLSALATQLDCVASLAPKVAAGAFKTLVAAWTTSSRCKECVRKTCLFGCNAADAIVHYARCPVLQHIVDTVFPHSAPFPLVSWPPPSANVGVQLWIMFAI